MEFEQKKRDSRASLEKGYHMENLKIVREFSRDLILEMKGLVRAVVLFGSNTSNTLSKDSDIDVMIVLDNVSLFVGDELREAYRIIVRNLTSKYSDKLHILTVNFSDFWDMNRKGDPVLINILRFGVPIFDSGIVEPMQYLLEIGKIKPSKETVMNYVARAETLLEETEKHLENAVLDLYYSVVDSVHSALMIKGVMPPSPKEMPDLFKEVFKGKSLAKYSKSIEELYLVAKKIDHRKIGRFSGEKYDELRVKAEEIVKSCSEFVRDELKKKKADEI